MLWRSTAWMRQIGKCYNTLLQQNIKREESAETRKFAALERMPLNDLRITRLILWIQYNSKMNRSRKFNVTFIRTVKRLFWMKSVVSFGVYLVFKIAYIFLYLGSHLSGCAVRQDLYFWGEEELLTIFHSIQHLKELYGALLLVVFSLLMNGKEYYH